MYSPFSDLYALKVFVSNTISPSSVFAVMIADLESSSFDLSITLVTVSLGKRSSFVNFNKASKGISSNLGKLLNILLVREFTLTLGYVSFSVNKPIDTSSPLNFNLIIALSSLET